MSDEAAGSGPAFSRVQARRSGLRFLGAPEGEGVGPLQEALASVLAGEGNTRRAYLSRLQHPGEERVRLALLIDGARPAARMAPPIAQGCQEVVSSIDLLFFETLDDEQVRAIEQGLAPFYVAKDA